MLPAGAQRRLLGREVRPPSGLLPDVDRVTGDHYYSRREYGRMFARGGFRHRRIHRRGSEFQSFVLWRS